jgi:hypothetical protein
MTTHVPTCVAHHICACPNMPHAPHADMHPHITMPHMHIPMTTTNNPHPSSAITCITLCGHSHLWVSMHNHQYVEDHLVVLCYVAVSPWESPGYVTSVTCSHTSLAYIHTMSITVLHYIQWFYLSLCDLPYHPTPPLYTFLSIHLPVCQQTGSIVSSHRTLSPFLTWLCQSKPASWTKVRAKRPLQTHLWVPIGTQTHCEREKCIT